MDGDDYGYQQWCGGYVELRIDFMWQLFWGNMFLPHRCWQSFGQDFLILPRIL